MYEQHFGLTEKPFRPNATGSAVFVGPQQSRVLLSLKKGLTATDAVIVVSGPAGVGKTTIVTRALETRKSRQMVAWIGRMHLAPDEVLELLLAGFGVQRRPPSTIQRFAKFKRLLTDWAASDVRVVIVVEDAARVGDDALLELESLTASDTGDGSGANIVLMGSPEFNTTLNSAKLARLRQRSRLAQSIAEFTAAEVRGYVKHAIRAAGGDFDTIFAAGATDMVYRCSQGIPRVINNLCVSALIAAAESKADRISEDLVLRIAADVHGLEPVLPAPDPAEQDMDPVSDLSEQQAREEQPVTATAPEPAAAPAVPSVRAEAPAPVLAAEPAPVPDPQTEKPTPAVPEPQPQLAAANEPESVQEPQAGAGPIPAPEPPAAPAEAPELTVKPEVAVELQLTVEADPEPVVEEIAAGEPAIQAAVPTPNPPPKKRIPPLEMVGADFQLGDAGDASDDIPTLGPEAAVSQMAPVSKARAGGDATEAVLEVPLVDPLEAAIDDLPILKEADSADTVLPPPENSEPGKPPASDPPAATKSAPVAEPDTTKTPTPAKPAAIEAGTDGADEDELLPDLDALEAAIAAARKREQKPVLKPAPDSPPPVNDAETPQITLDDSLQAVHIDIDPDLELVAEKLGNIGALEDMSDTVAETLFGMELEQAAAEALGKPAAQGTTGDFVEEPSPVMLDESKDMLPVEPAANQPDTPLTTPAAAGIAATPAEPPENKSAPGDFNLSMSQRFATLNTIRDMGAPAANDSKTVRKKPAAPKKAVPPKPAVAASADPVVSQPEIDSTNSREILTTVPPEFTDDKAAANADDLNPADKKKSSLLGLFKRSSKN